MLQWWKKRKLKKQNNLETKLTAAVEALEECYSEINILFEIRHKQYDDFMVESELTTRKYKRLLEEEKTTSKSLLDSRVNQIRVLKQEVSVLQDKEKNLESMVNTLKITLGHF